VGCGHVCRLGGVVAEALALQMVRACWNTQGRELVWVVAVHVS